MTESTPKKHPHQKHDAVETETGSRKRDASPAVAQLLDAISHEDLAEQYVQLAADFDNFRKRTINELDEKRKIGIEYAVIHLLPVLDTLERANAPVPGVATDDDAMRSGLDLVIKGFHESLGALGIDPIVEEHVPFDPALHECVVSEPSETVEQDTVVEVLQKGFRSKDRVIRPALVRVHRASRGSHPHAAANSETRE